MPTLHKITSFLHADRMRGPISFDNMLVQPGRLYVLLGAGLIAGINEVSAT
jgi:hypothetical protein